MYSVDGDDFPMTVGKLLLEKGLSISSAESCTGGLFASSLIDVPGISAVFDRGLVTYSGRAKIDELGVSKETLKSFGEVSEETAIEMAEGLHRVSGSDVCIAVTGIAGPDGGSEEKPVGWYTLVSTIKGRLPVRRFSCETWEEPGIGTTPCLP